MFEQFKFVNMSPSTDLWNHANAVLNAIIGLAPYSARVHGLIRQAGEGFFCEIQIDSAAVHFKADALAEKVESSLSQVSLVIKQQLERWKEARAF